MSVLSYNQIIELFEVIAGAHIQIQRFGTGELNEADLNKFIALNPNYPVFWATPIDVTSAPNTILYRFNLLFFDIVNKDKNNEQEVLSDTLQIALDVYRILKLENSEFGVIGEPTISPFAGAYSEYVAGWSMEIAIEVDFQDNLCDIPYEGLNLTQILKNFTGDGIGGFGCDDLGTCIDIININTNISNLDANQITGGTYFSATSTITLTNKTGGTIDITGITTSNQFNCDDLLNCTVVANSISGGTYQNGCLTLFNNSGGTTQICGFISADTFTTGGTYTSGQITFTRNDGQTYIVTGFPTGVSGGQIYYINQDRSQSPYREFSPIPITDAQSALCTTSPVPANSTITLQSYQTPVGYPNVVLIPPGIWSFYLHGCKSTSNACFNIWVEVYKRTTGGTETFLFQTSKSLDPFSTCSTVNMALSDGFYAGTSLDLTDRLVIKIKLENCSNQPHNFCLYTQGNQNYSYAITPFMSQGTLTCDNIDDCSVIQQIQTDISNKYDKSGGTINGNVSVVGGLSATLINTFAIISNAISANTISATTIDLCSTNGILYTDTIAGCSPINVLDQTNFLDGLSATTISATTYYGDGSNLTGIPRLGQISTIFDGLGGIIQLGLGKNYITIPYNCILTGWTIFSSVVGSIETDFYVDSYGNFPPTSADTIFTSINRPKLTNTNKNQATGLNIPLTSGSVLIQEVLSVTNCTNVVVNLRLIRTT